jgi:hypothetical protein
MLFKLKSKNREPISLVSSGTAVPTRIAALAVVGCCVACLSLIVQFLNYGAMRRLAKSEVPSLIQLSSGETIYAKAVEPAERSNETIKQFVSDSFVGMFNWDGLIQKNNAQGKLIIETDPGVEIKGVDENATKKVTTRAYEAAFALSEKQGFRTAFLRRLAGMTNPEIFSGNMRVAIIPTYISSPRKIKDGLWEIDFQSTLVTFKKSDNAGEPIAFNKTVTVQAITTPQNPPKDTTDIAKKIYEIRKPGLEIIHIIDLNLGRK